MKALKGLLLQRAHIRCLCYKVYGNLVGSYQFVQAILTGTTRQKVTVLQSFKW